MHNQHVIKSLKQFMTPQASANIKYRENKKTHEKNKNFWELNWKNLQQKKKQSWAIKEKIKQCNSAYE